MRRQIDKGMKKKGSVADLIITFTFITIIFVVSGVSLFVMNTFDDAWQDVIIVDNQSKETSANYANLFENVMDGAIIFYFVMLWIVSLVTASFLDTSPIFFILFVIIGIFSMVGIGALGLIMPALEDSQLAATFALMPMSSFLMNQIIWFAAVYFLTLGGALYFKLRQDG